MGEDDAADQRVGRVVKLDGGRKAGALVVRSGIVSSASSVAASIGGSRLGLGLERQARQQIGDPGIVAAGDPEGGEPRQHVDPAGEIPCLAECVAQSPPGVREAGVKGHGRKLRQQPAAVVVGSALAQGALEVGGGGLGVAFLSGLLGRALQQRAGPMVARGRQCSRWPATFCGRRIERGQGARRLAVQALALRRDDPELDCGSDQRMREALPLGTEDPGCGERRRGQSPGPRAPSRRPPQPRAAGAPSPITDCAAAAARSRGVSSDSNRRTVSTVSALTGAAPCVQSRTAHGPCSATWRPSSLKSHGLPSTDLWQSRHTAIDVSGAWWRIRVAAPRGDNGCGRSATPSARRPAGSAGPLPHEDRRSARRRR